MRVLIGFSRCPITVTILRQRGVEAFTCDLLPADHEWHMQENVWNVVDHEWDWAIFHPMCTYLTCMAAWAFKDPDYYRYPDVGYHQAVRPETLMGGARRNARRNALRDIEALMELPYPKAIENPATSFISAAIRKPDQVIQPWQFGDDASKGTGLWLDRMKPLPIDPAKRRPGRIVQHNGKAVERWSNQTDSGQNRVTPGAGRWLERSATYPGIATAMAEWSIAA